MVVTMRSQIDQICKYVDTYISKLICSYVLHLLHTYSATHLRTSQPNNENPGRKRLVSVGTWSNWLDARFVRFVGLPLWIAGMEFRPRLAAEAGCTPKVVVER